jgi:hypothetical protein
MSMLATIWCLAQASAASALPTMIRLGYADCAACHVSPQGGGLLTPYGKGIDAAQSLRRRDVIPDERPERLLYDVRFVLSGNLTSSPRRSDLAGATTFRFVSRNALNLSEQARFTYEVGLDTPTLTRSSNVPNESANVVIPKALFSYRPRNGMEFAIGRDRLPTGLGLPDPQRFIERQHDPLGTAFPAQIKAFLWTNRLQITPYVFGPGFDEDRSQRQRGGGIVAGVDIWKHHAVVGLSARMSESSVADRESVGAFARLGFGRWGILAEHDLTSRVTPADVTSRAEYVMGYTQIFVAPVEWFVPSLVIDDVVSTGPAARRTYRLAPSVAMRITEHLTVGLSTRDDFAIGDAPNSRTYAVTIAVKTVQ